MNLRQQGLCPNRLERAGYAILESLQVPFDQQTLIANKITVDAFLPEHNTVVQFDGNYWHGKPDEYPDPDHRQRKRMALDISQDAYLTKCGYNILRFWGSDIRKRPEWVVEQITSSLHIALPSEAQ